MIPEIMFQNQYLRHIRVFAFIGQLYVVKAANQNKIEPSLVGIFQILYAEFAMKCTQYDVPAKFTTQIQIYFIAITETNREEMYR